MKSCIKVFCCSICSLDACLLQAGSICPSGVQFVLRTFIAFGVHGVCSWLPSRYTVTPLHRYTVTPLYRWLPSAFKWLFVLFVVKFPFQYYFSCFSCFSWLNFHPIPLSCFSWFSWLNFHSNTAFRVFRVFRG